MKVKTWQGRIHGTTVERYTGEVIEADEDYEFSQATENDIRANSGKAWYGDNRYARSATSALARLNQHGSNRCKGASSR